ncbi:hypothetical protein D9M73_96580 [compost metagenome]
MLGVERQPFAGEPIRDARMDAAQPPDRGEQAEHSPTARHAEPRISIGERPHVAALHIGDDQHFGLARIIERRRRLESTRAAQQMRRPGARLGHVPIAAAAQGRRGYQHAMRGFQHGFGKGPRRIEPMPVQPNIIIAPLDAIDRHPIDEVGRSRAADPREQRQPRRHRLGAPAKRGHRAFDARARRAIHPVGRFVEHRLESPPERHQRAHQRIQRFRRRASRLDQAGIGLGKLGLQAITRIAARIAPRFGAGIGEPAHRRQQRLDRPERRALAQALQPAIARQRLRRVHRIGDRARAALVIARHIGQPRREPAPPPAPARFGAEHPTPELDRLGTGQRGREHRVGGIEQMMPLVEHIARRARIRFAPARGIDHHQRMVGDDQIGIGTRARRLFDEAFAVMRTTGIDALAAPVGERGRAVAAEQGRQPAGQIAADHIAVRAIRRPARDEVREDRGAPGEPALQRVLQVQQAQVILAALARDHLRPADCRIGKEPRAFMPQLPLQRLGEGRHPHRAIGLLRPERSGREITERLADAGAGFGEHHIGHPRRHARRKRLACRLRIGTLAGPLLGGAAGQAGEPRLRLVRFQRDGAGLRARRALRPFAELGEQPALGRIGLFEALGQHRCPGPAETEQRLRRRPRALAFGPLAFDHAEQRPGGCAQEGGDFGIGGGRRQPRHAREPARRRHHEARRAQKGEQFEQIEPGQIGIAQPLPDQGGIEQDDRRIGGDPDRLPPPDRPRAVLIRNPDAAMAGVQRRIGQRKIGERRHRADSARAGTKGQP